MKKPASAVAGIHVCEEIASGCVLGVADCPDDVIHHLLDQ